MKSIGEMLYMNGYVNAISMAEFSSDLALPTDTKYERNIVSILRKGQTDFVYDKYWVEQITNILKANEILIVETREDVSAIDKYYYRIKLATNREQMHHYKLWCEEHTNSKNLKKYIEEVRVIWL